MRKPRTWDETKRIVTQLETCLKEYGFAEAYKPAKGKKQYILDFDHGIYKISGLGEGWWCDYPKLEPYIDILNIILI